MTVDEAYSYLGLTDFKEDPIRSLMYAQKLFNHPTLSNGEWEATRLVYADAFKKATEMFIAPYLIQ